MEQILHRCGKRPAQAQRHAALNDAEASALLGEPYTSAPAAAAPAAVAATAAPVAAAPRPAAPAVAVS